MLSVLRLCEEIAITKALDLELWKKGCCTYTCVKLQGYAMELIKMSAQRVVFGFMDFASFLMPFLEAAKVLRSFLDDLQRSFCNKEFLDHVSSTGEFITTKEYDIFNYVPATHVLGLFRENVTSLVSCGGSTHDGKDGKGKFSSLSTFDPYNLRTSKQNQSDEELWEMNRCPDIPWESILPGFLQPHGRSLSKVLIDTFWLAVRVALASVEMDWILDDWHDEPENFVEEVFQGKDLDSIDKYCRVTNRRFHFAMRRMGTRLKIKFFCALIGMDWDHIA